jgi:hypothetical protein
MDSLLESKSFDDTDMSSTEYDPPSGSESDFKIIPESVFYDIDKLRGQIHNRVTTVMISTFIVIRQTIPLLVYVTIKQDWLSETAF